MENICNCCGQTLTTKSSINKGTIRLLSQIFKFVGQGNENKFHPEKDLVRGGYINSNQRNNLNHLSNHGLVAPHKESGYWVITRKGGKFMRGDCVQKVAIIDKATKITTGYEGELVTYSEILKSSDPYWYQPYFDITESGDIMYKTKNQSLF